jgi:hypothetical protein
VSTPLSVSGGRGAMRLLPVILLAVVAFAAALLIQARVAPLGSGDADEGVYVAQANLLRSGQVTLDAASHEPFFRPWLTGERDGRLFFQYEPAWPAVLAVSEIVTGTTAYAPAAAFAALVVVAYGLALELLGSRGSAFGAAVCTLLTPLFLFYSALTLAYLFTAALCLGALWCAARVARGGDRWPSVVALGALAGTLLLTRPVDGVLAMAACALLLASSGPDRWRELPRLALLGLAAVAPFLLVAGWFNLKTTGSLTSFPLSASDPLNRFGFGERRMQIGTAATHYDVHTAATALVDNLRGGIGWLFGGAAALALIAVALIQRTGRARRLVLVIFAGLFPLTYFFWWANAMAAPGATNGIGPHYYVPAFAALAILEGDGLAHLVRWARRTWSRIDLRDPRPDRARSPMAIGSVAVGLLTLTTLPNLPDKWAVQDYVNALYANMQHAVPRDLGPALIILRNDPPQRFLLFAYPFQRNRPSLDGDLLWALDRGGENGPMIQAHPDRTPYALRSQRGPEDDLLHPRWHLTRLSVRHGSPLPLSILLRPPAKATNAVVEVRGGADVLRPAPPAAGGSGEVAVTLTGCGNAAAPGGAPSPIEVPAGSSELRVALSTASGERWEQQVNVWCDQASGTIFAELPGTGSHRIDFGDGKPVSIAEDVSPIIELR